MTITKTHYTIAALVILIIAVLIIFNKTIFARGGRITHSETGMRGFKISENESPRPSNRISDQASGNPMVHNYQGTVTLVK